MLLALTACAGGAGSASTTSGGTPAGASSTPPGPSATIEIQVRIGEQCHPEPMTPGPSCRPQPRPDTEVSLTNTSTDEVVEVRTGADGTARVVVAPGNYLVRARAEGNYTDPPEETVIVAPGGVAHAVLTYLVGLQ